MGGLFLYLYSQCRQDTKVQDTTTAAAVKYNDVFGRQRFQIRLVLFLFWDTQPPMKTLIQFHDLFNVITAIIIMWPRIA